MRCWAAVVCVLLACSGELPEHAVVRGALEEPEVQPWSIAKFPTLTGCPQSFMLQVQTNVDAGLADGTYTIGFYDNGLLVHVWTSDGIYPFELTLGHHLYMLAIRDASGEPIKTPKATKHGSLACTNACTTDSDCTTQDVCDTPACVPSLPGPTCKFGASPWPGCCHYDVECSFGKHCDLALNKCVANECDCAVPAEAPCDDGKYCTFDACQCGTGSCLHEPLGWKQGTCCETGDDEACFDGDPTTKDRCIAHVCLHVPIVPDGNICVTAADCNDGNVCSVDSCQNNLCEHQMVDDPNCCQSSDDPSCDDQDPFTIDKCISYQCVNTIVACVCIPTFPSDVILTELMLSPAEWIEVWNSRLQEVDLAGWTLGHDDPAAPQIVLASLVIPSWSYRVLCAVEGPGCDVVYGEGLPLDDVAGNVSLRSPEGYLESTVDYGAANVEAPPQGQSLARASPLETSSWAWQAETPTPGVENHDFFDKLPGSKGPCVATLCEDCTSMHQVTKPNCCGSASDCTLPTPCHAASCANQQCAFTALPDCCITNDQCDDANPVTIDTCLLHECRHLAALP